MNFLSHFYFERFATHPERVVGSLLPDLLKNFDKSYTFHPQRFEEQLFTHPLGVELSEGWYRHVEVDKLFHSSTYFIDHSHYLRKELDPVIADLPIRGTFLAHIAIELILDHLLIKHELVNVSRLYENLANVNRTVLKNYLITIGVPDVDGFLTFYDKFIAWRYIFEYKDLEQISKPLINISKRIWQFDVTADVHERMTAVLLSYTEERMHDFKDVYAYIQDNLTYLS